MSLLDSRDSVLEGVVSRYQQSKLRCSRLVLVGSIHPASNALELIECLQKFMENQAKIGETNSNVFGFGNKTVVSLTGMLVMLNKSVLLCLEGNTKVINQFLKEIKERENEYSKVVKAGGISDSLKDATKEIKDTHKSVFGAGNHHGLNARASVNARNSINASNSSVPEQNVRSSLAVGGEQNVRNSVSLNHLAVEQPASLNLTSSINMSSSVNTSQSGAFANVSTSGSGTFGNVHVSVVAPTSPEAPNSIPTPILANVRIVAMHEEVSRACKYFSIRQLQNVPKPENEDFKKDPTTVIIDCLTGVVEVGKLLSSCEDAQSAQQCFSTGSIQTATATKSLVSRIPASEQHINFISSLDCLMNMNEYLGFYCSPLQIVLESEKVWPVEPHLKY